MAMRLLVMAIVAAIAFGALAVFVSNATAGVAAKTTVNTVANTGAGTGDCDTTPDDGTCTLREAINYVNDGLADEINFHPPVFSKASPGVISIEDLDGGGGNLGCLPPIEVEVTIDSTNTGVIIDGDGNDDGTFQSCDGGLEVQADSNGHDFALNGGKNFVIRQIDGDGIELDGDETPCPFSACSFGDVDINGVVIEDVENDGIDIRDTTNLNNISVTNNEIVSDGHGINMRTDGSDLTDNNVDVSGNRILGDADDSGPGRGVEIAFDGDLGSKITASVSDNPSIAGGVDGPSMDAVHLAYCPGGGCEADDGAINFSVNDNGKVHGGGDGIRINIDADGSESDDGGEVEVTVEVNNNGRTDAANRDGVKITVKVCCAESDSTSSVTVDGNDDIIGDSDGVDIEVSVRDGDDNVSDVSVSNNTEITGEGAHGVIVKNHAGFTGSDDDADENASTVTVVGNGEISGDGDDGVNIDNSAGKTGGDGEADGNVSTVTVSENGDISGEDDGVFVKGRAGNTGGSGDADDNTSTVTVDDNGDIEGAGDDGVDIDIDAGHAASGPPGPTGDDNSTVVSVSGNASIHGRDDHGVRVDSKAGGVDDGEGDSTSVTVNGNGRIKGENSGGEGVHVISKVCCDSANTNTIDISDNLNDIIGQDDDGIEIDVCCSVNTVSIVDNEGDIRGNDGHGINYDADTSAIADSVNLLTVTGNNISNSQDNGIDICCGGFEYIVSGETVGKSVISNNQIDHNSDHGIEVHNSIGLNIGPDNEIFGNGNNAAVDGGIEIDLTELDAAVDGNHNTITQNMIYDNIGPGIDLNGDEDLDNSYDDDGSADDHGIGCTFFASGASPNDCIPFPDLVTQAGDKLIGTAPALSTVEVFWADNTPSDNGGHGEGAEFIISGEADADGNFSIDLPCDLDAGDLTATATDKIKNTSEFSANIPTLGTSVCATATPTASDTPTITNTPPPTATFTPAPPTATPTPTKDCGDVNDDGSVTAVDSSLILQLKAGLIVSLDNPDSADVDGDGDITSIDASLILQLSAGLITELTGCS